MNYEFEVLTIRDLDFKDHDGKPVSGMQLWLIGETSDPAWNGYEVVKVWIPKGHKLEADVSILKRFDRIEVTFDRRGKPSAIKLVA